MLRWTSPHFGPISPAEFIPIAEENGLIVPIGAWVLHQACQVASRWPSEATIAVNLSPVQLRMPDLTATVESALRASALPARRLTLEVTETVLLDDVERSVAALAALNRIHVCTTLDDFGTGYSSLSYLTQFPFQTLKIDRSFVLDLEHNPASIAIVQTIVELAAKLGMKTVAEGWRRTNNSSSFAGPDAMPCRAICSPRRCPKRMWFGFSARTNTTSGKVVPCPRPIDYLPAFSRNRVCAATNRSIRFRSPSVRRSAASAHRSTTASSSSSGSGLTARDAS